MTEPTGTVRRGWRHSFLGLAGFHFLSLLGVFTALRLALYFSFPPPGAVDASDLARAFATGVYLDSFVALGLTLPLLFWRWLVPRRWFGRTWHRWLFGLGLLLFWTVEVFLLFSEYYFFDEFKSRFNTVAVDYLLYPDEVFINIWDSYPVVKVVGACVGLALAWCLLARRWFGGVWEQATGRGRSFLLLAGAAAAAGAMATQLSFNLTRFSTERLINELANNGAISFVTAAWTRHLDYPAFYRTMPREEAYARVRGALEEPGVQWTADTNSLRRRIAGDPARPKLNVVIILVESFGSEFWGSLGRPGPTLTPEMDRLAATDGLLFTNLYASGNRTVRGLEGVLSSFPPLPGDSIVWRHLTDNVETLARVLRRDGYTSFFVYGGQRMFDRMDSYALRNGFERFISQSDFEDPSFTTIWGVSDEDLFRRSIAELRTVHQQGTPFFATILTVSNHKPYTYPEGRIPEDPKKKKRNHAVKYTDYAIGQFFQAARQEPFWTNTVFAVVADHGARVYGSQSLPIHSYEIPLLVAGPAAVAAPARVGALGGSLDVAPTLLGLIGRPYESVFMGRDLLKLKPGDGRVFLHHNRDVGLYARERLVALGLNRKVEFYAGDPKVVDLQPLPRPTDTDREVEQEAIAFYQVADDLYMNQRYRVDDR